MITENIDIKKFSKNNLHNYVSDPSKTQNKILMSHIKKRLLQLETFPKLN